ncbi:hypothetical protein C8R47DRAFT_474380 [Mycena vitilis]|nr:hypothetical protein C8R47DRAFT_474380 [Mycena vitilis]
METQSQTASRNEELRTRANLDSEIIPVRVCLDRLELTSERERPRTEPDTVTVSCPVLALPVEIVSQIFCWALESEDQDPDLTPLEKPLRLGQICGFWRQIALSTPELWNAIRLDIGSRSHLFKRHHTWRIHTSLSRAGSLPLTIAVLMTEQSPGAESFTKQMLQIFVSHSRAWGNIRIEPMSEALSESLQAVHRQLPRLRSLELIMVKRPQPGEFGLMFEDAPLLRTVELSCFGSQKLALPWAQLTSLDLDRSTQAHLADILNWAPNIINLILRTIPRLHLVSPISHSGLRSIIFAGAAEYPREIFSFLHAPQLLQLKMAARSSSPFEPSLVNSASLQRLSLHIYGTITPIQDGLVDGLATLRSLKTLKLTGFSSKSAIPSLDPILSRLAKDPGFLPALESLSITMLNETYPSPSKSGVLVQEMLQSRLSSTLRHFEFRSQRPFPGFDSGSKEVEKLTATGMRIRLETNAGLNGGFRSAEF